MERLEHASRIVQANEVDPIRAGHRSPSARLAALALAFFVSLLVTSCGGGGEDSPDSSPSVLARVGDEVITVEAFEAEFARRSERLPGRFDVAEARRGVLDEMIATAAEVDRARKEGIDRDPEVVQEVDRLLVRHLRARELEARLAEIEISDADVAEAYADQQERLRIPARSRAALVQVRVSEGATPERRAEQRARAEGLLVEAASLPASVRGFGPIAARHSDDRVTRYKGGDIGWLEHGEAAASGRFGAEVAEAVFALDEPRELGPLVETPDGFHLVMLLDRTPASVRPLAEVEPFLRRELHERARAEIEARWRNEIVERVDIAINEALLDAARTPMSGVARSTAPAPPPLPE